MTSLIGKGAYGIPESARLARVNTQTARRWIRGYGRDYLPLLSSDIPPVQSRRALSFLDLIDLLVVGRFRDEGVSLQLIRKVYAELRASLGSDHPFSHHCLLTDGRTVFLETLDSVGDKHLEEVLTGQRAIPEILRPYLAQIDYSDQTRMAARWHVADGVVLDPIRSFGKPVVAEGTTTHVLARSYWANGEDLELVADLFNVAVASVESAVAFESEFDCAA